MGSLDSGNRIGLGNVDILKALGKVSVRKGEKKGDGVVEIAVDKEKFNADKVHKTIFGYFTEANGLDLTRLSYDPRTGEAVVEYHNIKGAKAKTRGSSGCGGDMLPYYRR
jgi:hypothetical protein